MRSGADTIATVSTDEGGIRPARSLRSLLAWVWPYLRPSRAALAVVAAIAIVMLAAQAVTPLLVERILAGGVWNAALFAALAALIVLQVATGHALERMAHTIASRTGHRLRISIFDRLLRTRVLHQDGLVRSSSVSRHTADVDDVTIALESTLVAGIPGIIRLIQSLVLLTFIEWRAGVCMTGAAMIFLLVRSGVGRGLIVADRERLDARSRVSQNVDEAITAAHPIRGMRLGEWVRTRFASASSVLQAKSIAQGTYLAQLSSAARAAGLAGLLFVVIFAVALGGTTLAAAAAALLYIEAVVRSLEALPPWVRQLQLALVSRARIDQILTAPEDAERPTTLGAIPGIIDVLDQVAGDRLIGVVPGIDVEADDALSLMARSGQDLHVTQEPAVANLRVIEHLRALRPELSTEEAGRLLDVVGLTSSAVPAQEPIGPGGSLLTVSERQLLTLAMALAGDPRTILVGPILALRDPDGALHLIRRIADAGPSRVAVAVTTPEVAEAMDHVVFVRGSGVEVGTHAELLVSVPEYAALWHRRLQSDDVDLTSLGIDGDAATSMHARLVMERYAAGDIVYRQGDPADRVVFIVAGRLEILTGDDRGNLRRVAVVGPGNHCGDLRLTVGETRAETVRCLDDAVVRSLSRSAISSGMVGLLDRTDAERRLLTSLLRQGSVTQVELRDSVPDVTDEEFNSALALLLRDGAVQRSGDTLTPATRRSTKSGAEDVLDRLTGLL